MNYQWPAVGAFLHPDNKCTFTVWCPQAKSVTLLLNNTDSYDLFPDKVGYWTGLPLGQMIIYGLHIGTFTDAGTFEGIISKLDYLQLLGINAIELMPVATFAGNRNWGYDGVFPFAVHAAYGRADGLKRLVNEAHHRGIAVLLDVVYNHMGPEGNYFEQYGPWFTDKYRSVWAKSLNFDDEHCDAVRHYCWQHAWMWLDEFRLDGLRLDAVHAIWDSGADHFIAALPS